MGVLFSCCCGDDANKYTAHLVPPQNGRAVPLKNLPKGKELVSTWTKTGIIGLRDRGLKELPVDAVAAIGEQARVLDAGGNQLRAVSATVMAPLISLQRLVLAGNQLAEVPPCLPPTLKILTLANNRIESLQPSAFTGLTVLQRLDLASNQIQFIPPGCLSGLLALEVLVLDNNQLRALPDDLGTCPALEELSAANNQIIAIPASLGQLKKLKTLNMTHNLVREVPAEVLRDCCSLQTLTLHQNPIKPDELQASDGFADFEARRIGKYSKAIATGAMLPSKGLDEGVDRATTRG